MLQGFLFSFLLFGIPLVIVVVATLYFARRFTWNAVRFSKSWGALDGYQRLSFVAIVLGVSAASYALQSGERNWREDILRTQFRLP
jgi:hypothetical protein